MKKIDAKDTFTSPNSASTSMVDLPAGKPEFLDIVYLWADSSDPTYIEERTFWWSDHTQGLEPSKKWPPTRSNGELQHSLRSIERNMPWVRKVFIVTNNQVPDFLQLENNRVQVVSLDEIMPDYTPSFNSHAIYLSLDNIPGLSEWFLQFDDDFFCLKPTDIDFFFTEAGLPITFVSKGKRPNDMEHTGLPHQAAQLYRKFGVEHCKQHVYWAPHLPRLFSKTLIAETKRLFSNLANKTLQSRFRSQSDLDLTSFYPYIAANCSSGRLVWLEDELITIKIFEDTTLSSDKIKEIERSSAHFLVIQDAVERDTWKIGDQMNGGVWEKTYKLIYNSFFSEPSQFEKQGATSKPRNKVAQSS